MTIGLTLSLGVERMHGSADGRAATILRRKVDHMNSADFFLGGPRTSPMHDANFPRGTIPLGLAQGQVARRPWQGFGNFDRGYIAVSVLLRDNQL